MVIIAIDLLIVSFARLLKSFDWGTVMAQPSKPPQTPTTSSSTEMTLARMGAQTQLDFELAFFGSILDRHPSYLEMLRTHAKNLSLVKRYVESMQIDRRIIQLAPSDPLAHYNLACSYALLKQTDTALSTLRRAVELGYRDFEFMRQDRDLDSIRKDPRFRQLLREYDK
jgi:tetratricopeptide (TPR) repeat protein